MQCFYHRFVASQYRCRAQLLTSLRHCNKKSPSSRCPANGEAEHGGGTKQQYGRSWQEFIPQESSEANLVDDYGGESVRYTIRDFHPETMSLDDDF
jgi:hypothetical protein